MAKQNLEIEIEGKLYPLSVHFERRRDVRYSIATKSIHLRLPYGMSLEEANKEVEKITEWAAGIFKDNPEVKKRFETKTYSDGQVIQVGDYTYRLKIGYTPNKSHAGQLLRDNTTIALRLTKNTSEQDQNEAAKYLISRIVAAHRLPGIIKRVGELNRKHFNRAYKNVKLKYNVTNWGSCSKSGNINLSSRLLFAPQDVIDSVIIHELAHLIEPNHSPAFWELVFKAMPDYEEKAQWLKDNASWMDF